MIALLFHFLMSASKNTQINKEFKILSSFNLFHQSIFVFKCLNGTGPSVFNNYFKRLDHVKGTRWNSIDLWIPKLTTESEKRGIYYSGTKILNALPLHIKLKNITFISRVHQKNILGINSYIQHGNTLLDIDILSAFFIYMFTIFRLFIFLFSNSTSLDSRLSLADWTPLITL